MKRSKEQVYAFPNEPFNFPPAISEIQILCINLNLIPKLKETAMSLTHLFYGGNGSTSVDSGLPRVGVIHGVRENGDLLWYRYNGHGESDR
jgi:hypothetical protein